jgi:hypothetical protein
MAKALDVIDFDLQGTIATPYVLSELPEMTQSKLVSNEYFVVEELSLHPGAAYYGACDGSTLEIWGCMLGEGQVEWRGTPIRLPAIRYTLLPAALGEFQVVARQPSTFLRVYLPKT